MNEVTATNDTTLGEWTLGPPLPSPVENATVVQTHNRVYLLGGWSNDKPSSTVYTTSIRDEEQPDLSVAPLVSCKDLTSLKITTLALLNITPSSTWDQVKQTIEDVVGFVGEESGHTVRGDVDITCDGVTGRFFLPARYQSTPTKDQIAKAFSILCLLFENIDRAGLPISINVSGQGEDGEYWRTVSNIKV